MDMITSGEVKVFMLQQHKISTDKKGKRSISFAPIAKNYYFGQLGYDAKVITLSNKNIKEKMIPYLNKCSAFKNGYNGKFGAIHMISAATYYNEHCDK